MFGNTEEGDGHGDEDGIVIVQGEDDEGRVGV